MSRARSHRGARRSGRDCESRACEPPRANRSGMLACRSSALGRAIVANDSRHTKEDPMLTRAEMSRDQTFHALTEAILERDQPRTTDLFWRMVTRERRPLGDALATVAAAEAPFVQVPSHIN